MNSDASNFARPGWVSTQAKLVVKGSNDDSVWGEARVGRRRVAQLNWTIDGRLLHEMPLDEKGERHGVEAQHDESGRVVWCAQWMHGAMHGPMMQFDERGRPILLTHFVRGKGTDLWAECGKVTEMREMADGKLHGLTRWGDPRRPIEEEYFFAGRRHGIFRRWQPTGELRKGFPRFYIKDNRVSRQVYQAAQAKDPSLPEYRLEDDLNLRVMPSVVAMALKGAKRLREELAMIDHVQ